MVLFFFWCVIAIHSAASSCPPGWTHYEADDSCLRMSSTRTSFDGARAACQGEYGDLAKITDKGKFDLIYGNESAWIGVHDPGKNQTFQYVDGTPLTSYQPWGEGEPNNSGNLEYCVGFLDNKRNGRWNDFPCAFVLLFVCEIGYNRAPFCPSETRVVDAGIDHLRIEWMPDSPPKAGDRFVILFQLWDSNSDYKELKEIVAKETINKEKVIYDLSGLKPQTFYTLSVGTRNTYGFRDCKRNRFIATTKCPTCQRGCDVHSTKKGDEEWDPSHFTLVIGVNGLILFLSVAGNIVLLIFLWKRKPQNTPQETSANVNLTWRGVADADNRPHEEKGHVQISKAYRKPIDGKLLNVSDREIVSDNRHPSSLTYGNIPSDMTTHCRSGHANVYETTDSVDENDIYLDVN